MSWPAKNLGGVVRAMAVDFIGVVAPKTNRVTTRDWPNGLLDGTYNARNAPGP